MHTLDHIRTAFNSTSNRADRSRIGQFLTPVSIAEFMASLFGSSSRHVRILDPGAGTGVLFAACVETLIASADPPRSIEVVAYETDSEILPYLEDTIRKCQTVCESKGIEFHGRIRFEDFVSAALAELNGSLFLEPSPKFTHVILNPPYKKLNIQTPMSRKLYLSGIEVANLYAVFVWLSMLLLVQNGQMVAITPRSFCNGPYFKKFRTAFLQMMNLKRIHIFESRRKAFGDDNVLQENIIYHAVRGLEKPEDVSISVSEGLDFERIGPLTVPYGRVVIPGDRDMFIRLDVNKYDGALLEQVKYFSSSLSKLGLSVSTGRVVDFRARKHLRRSPEQGDAPLIYPCHFANGFIIWPLESGKKPNAIASNEETASLLVEAGFYVLTKRFSSKEQQRRIMAAVYDPERTNASYVGFENHLNYYHRDGRGLPVDLAKGLALYLNSTLVDQYFRLFSGHTQVNANDLRKMPYPTREQLLRFGASFKETMPDQETIDSEIEKECSTLDE
ncbi:MAG: Eco57I restriction-modification methylase domain-containing protein [Syntrophaceae bacterium]